MVDDGAPITQTITAKSNGTVKYFQLIGDFLQRAENIEAGKIVDEKGLFAVVIDEQDREAVRHYIARGSKIEVGDNSQVELTTTLATPNGAEQVVIAQWDPYSNPIIAQDGGKIEFEDIVPGVTATEQYDDITGESRIVINEYIPAGYKPSLILVGKTGTFKYALDPKTALFVANEQEIVVADTLAKTPKAVSKSKDITGGLPRVSELFEARHPKDQSILAEFDGTVTIGKPLRNKIRLIVTGVNGETAEYLAPKDRNILIHSGEFVHAGEQLTDGQISAHDILTILGEKTLHYFIISEIQQVYRSQGVGISDKHIEVILSQMLRQVNIQDSGDTKFIEGDMISRKRFNAENQRILELGGEPALAKPLLLGITRTAVTSDSIISAASFQETTKVLTEAAVSGKMDMLEDLKENIVIGRTIPVGTGLYKDMKIKFATE
jgi:DNA-directed RNA polymerase subunit beta'